MFGGDFIDSTLDNFAAEYLFRLGTPYPVGERITTGARFEQIERYEVTPDLQLVAVTDQGTVLKDYEQLADAARRTQIRDFYESARG